MRKAVVIMSFLLLALGACSSGSDSKQSKDNAPPKKTVFDSYVQDVNKAKKVQGTLDAAQQKANAQLQQAESASTSSQPDSAQPPSNH
ncbi:MAG TPA: hypothetical protein VFL15_03925 [Gammaproteobacteria bacterium]|nr:hypothetical protein [Gammaproteobacteria bacterium]